MGKTAFDVDGSYFNFYYEIYENGIYKCKLLDSENNLVDYQFIKVDTIGFDIFYDDSPTDEPLYVYSNTFDLLNDYLVEYSTDRVNWLLMESEIFYENNVSKVKNFMYLYSNGTYYFRFSYVPLEPENVFSCYVTKEINNLSAVGNLYFDDTYVPNPIISIDFNTDTESFILKTQNFFLDKALNMYCYYTDDFTNDDFTTWEKMDLDFTKDDIYEYTESGLKRIKDSYSTTSFKQAFYYFEIPLINAQDTDYKIVLYNFWSEESSDVVIYEFKYQQALDYVENELQVKMGLGTKINTAVKFFKERFGFLTFPIDLMISIMTRLTNIQYKEPVIHFPTLTIPTTEFVICEGFDYNLNSILEISAINTLYNIYLIAVDFILISALLGFTYKTLKEVLHR